MLKRLKEYKEFIAILMFFFAGGVWLYADFVTKEWLTQEIKLLNANNARLVQGLETLVSQVQSKNHQLQRDIRQQTCWDAAAFSMLRNAIEVSETRARLGKLRLRHFEQKPLRVSEAALADLQREIDQVADQLEKSETLLGGRLNKAGNRAVERCALAI